MQLRSFWRLEISIRRRFPPCGDSLRSEKLPQARAKPAGKKPVRRSSPSPSWQRRKRISNTGGILQGCSRAEKLSMQPGRSRSAPKRKQSALLLTERKNSSTSSFLRQHTTRKQRTALRRTLRRQRPILRHSASKRVKRRRNSRTLADTSMESQTERPPQMKPPWKIPPKKRVQRKNVCRKQGGRRRKQRHSSANWTCGLAEYPRSSIPTLGSTSPNTSRNTGQTVSTATFLVPIWTRILKMRREESALAGTGQRRKQRRSKRSGRASGQKRMKFPGIWMRKKSRRRAVMRIFPAERMSFCSTAARWIQESASRQRSPIRGISARRPLC